MVECQPASNTFLLFLMCLIYLTYIHVCRFCIATSESNGSFRQFAILEPVAFCKKITATTSNPTKTYKVKKNKRSNENLSYSHT